MKDRHWLTEGSHWLASLTYFQELKGRHWSCGTQRPALSDTVGRTTHSRWLQTTGHVASRHWLVSRQWLVTDARPSNSLNRQCGQSTGALHPKGLVGGKPELPYPVYSPAGLQLTVSVHWLIMMSLVITWHLSDKQACQASEKPIIKSINTTN